MLLLLAWSWEVREPEISCVGALCRLTQSNLPLCRVGFFTISGGNWRKAPKKKRLWRSFSACVPAEIFWL
jgi:hypothetical protein